MKKSLNFILAFSVSIVFFLFYGMSGEAAGVQAAVVYVDHDIVQDTVWSGGNVYYICSTGNSEPKILNGATLTIGKGATVYFADVLSGDLPDTGKRPSESITIESGHIFAEGVKFTSVPGRENRGWGNIEIRGEPGRANTAEFIDCVFEYSGFFGNGAAIIAVEKNYKGEEGQEIDLTVTGCTFQKASPGSTAIVYDNGYHLAGKGQVVIEGCDFNDMGRGVQVLRNSQDDIDTLVNGCTFNNSTLRSVEIMDGRLAQVTNNVFNNNSKDHHSIMMLYDYNDSNHPKEVIIKDNTFNGASAQYPMIVHAASKINKDEDHTNNYSENFPDEFKYVQLFGNVGPPAWAGGTESAVWGNVGVPYVMTAQLAVTRADNVNYSDLLINPGVTVCMDKDVNFLIEGSLRAIGTKDQPITICRKPGAEQCGQIQLSHFKGQVEMSHCVIDGLFRGAWLEADDDNTNEVLVSMDSCVIRNSVDCQIAVLGNYTSKGRIIIKNSIIEGNPDIGNNGIAIDGGRRVYLQNNLIHGFPDSGIVYLSNAYYNETETAVFIENCTIADNTLFGLRIVLNAPFNADVTEYGVSVHNSIIYGNDLMDIGVTGDNRNDDQVKIAYSLLGNDAVEYIDGFYEHPDGTRFIELPDTAYDKVIYGEPLFADPAGKDYRLMSKNGRWNGETWVKDRKTSPAVDAGDPASAYDQEPSPNGRRINMGYLGNTEFASKSAGSFFSGLCWLWILLLILLIIIMLILIITRKIKKEDDKKIEPVDNSKVTAILPIFLVLSLLLSGCSVIPGNTSSSSNAGINSNDILASSAISNDQSNADNSQISRQAGEEKIHLKVQAAPVIISGLETVSTKDFSIELPKGWTYETNPANLEFGLIAYDPQQPERRLFYYYMFNPFMKSEAARNYFKSAYGSGNIYAGCPVLDPPEVTEFFYKWNEYIDWLESQGIKAATMKFNELNIVERHDLENLFSAYALDTAVVRAHTRLEGSELICEGLLSASVVSLNSYDMGGVDYAPLNVYNVMGIMAPADEFVQIQEILNQSLSSFTISQSYANEYVRESQEATRIMTESWQKRQNSNDVISQKKKRCYSWV